MAGKSVAYRALYEKVSDTHRVDGALRAAIAGRLRRFEYRDIEDPGLRHAAVALVVAEHERFPGHPAILLTRRPKKLNQHSGQYALPGGKLDSGETCYQAAVRELREELGVSVGEDSVLGRLDDYPTRSAFRITPVVVWLGTGCKLAPNPDEVARVFFLPFSELDSEAIPVFEQGVEAQRPILCSEFPTLGHRMYSPTAAMIYQFREVAIRGKGTRVAHYDQPQFAWR